VEHLFAYMTGADTCDIVVECPAPGKFKKKGLVCLKLTSDALTPENIEHDLVFFELS